VDMTREYRFVGIDRQEVLTKAIQQRLANVAPKGDGPSPNDAQREPRWSRSMRKETAA
jgi:hypothetical protein